jgi:hypothetical protein
MSERKGMSRNSLATIILAARSIPPMDLHKVVHTKIHSLDYNSGLVPLAY